jgi:hypothetical protein
MITLVVASSTSGGRSPDAAREVDAAHDVAGGELGAGAAGLLVAHQVADIVHQGADQRRIEVVAIQALAGQMQAVQHARRAQHHLVGMAAVVIQGLELLVAGQPPSKARSSRSKAPPTRVRSWPGAKLRDDPPTCASTSAVSRVLPNASKGAVVVHAVHTGAKANVIVVPEISSAISAEAVQLIPSHSGNDHRDR